MLRGFDDALRQAEGDTLQSARLGGLDCPQDAREVFLGMTDDGMLHGAEVALLG